MWSSLSATLPDPEILEIVCAKGFDETKFSATFRYPHWPFWPAMLRFLYEHGEEFITKASVKIGRIVQLWLDYAPQGLILRREAAELGLMLGEKARLARGDYSSYKHRKDFYYVALAGARELPDRISDFALIASERTGENSTEEDQEQGYNPVSIITRSDPRFDPNEPLPEPWPDGPRRNVDDEFRKVIIEAKTLLPLIHVNPAVAREVTLAVLICHRRRYEWASHRSVINRLDLEDTIGWTTPLYTRGPFLAFLQTNFLEGLELIARLVDFATERWKHRTEVEANEYNVEEENERDTDEFLAQLVKENRRPPGTVFILIDNVECEFIGDSRVYGWSAGLGNPPHSVEVALMALEQYFYLCIEREQTIDEEVLTVLRRVRSVAFLKVLCDVGKRLPTLFENSLKPLLSVPEIYSWDIRVNVEGRSHLMIGAFIEGEQFFQLARQFNELEHRKKDLRHLALALLLANLAMRAFFEEVRQRWETRFLANSEDENHDFLQQLILTFNVNNYQIQQHLEYDSVIINTQIQELQAARADELRNNELNLLILSFPIRCRMYLERKESLTENDLDTFWEELQQFASRGDGNDQNNQYTPSQIANCICGGIAVLVHFHRNWLAQYPEREQWCLDYLRDIVRDPPLAERFDIPESTANFSWDCFVAEALPLIWAEDKDNEEARSLVALMVFARHYKAVNILFDRCAELRSVLLEDFKRLRRLLFEWAFVRKRIAFVEGFQNHIERELIQQFSEEVNKWAREQVRAFVEARTPSTIETWRLMDESDHFRAIDETMPSWRRQKYLDFQLIKAAHAWLPTLDKVSNTEERCNIIEFWSEALAYVIRRVSVSEEPNQWHRENFYPNELEEWVLNNVAVVILYMDSNERPEKLWKPILDLPQKAHSWSEIFMRAFHQYGLQQNSTPLKYVLTTCIIINYILPSGSAKPKWSYHEDVWEELIGLGQFSIDKWDERHSSLVKEMKNLFEDWFRRVPIYNRRIALFAQWLKRPVADPIRLQALVWLEEMLKKENDDYILNEKSVTEAIACLLNTVWVRDQKRLRQNNSVFEAFRNLLRLLTDRQDEIALELVRRISKQ